MFGEAWFQSVFGVPETNGGFIRETFIESDGTLISRLDGRRWTCGRLEIVDLATLRQRVAESGTGTRSRLRVSELVDDAQALHLDPANAHALFQVASQFNLLEMISPQVTPEQGIERYATDATQGPACAMACAAGTLYRNYLVPLGGQVGQTADRQIDCLGQISDSLGNADQRWWRMKNGYALPTPEGLRDIDSRLRSFSAERLDALRGQLQIGVQWDTQVTLGHGQHLVTQAYCSALPVAYGGGRVQDWERFARLILEAAYEATLAVAVENAARRGNPTVFLTLLGGGAFGNSPEWIIDSLRRALGLFVTSDLDVRIVSYRRSNPLVAELVEQFR